MTPDQAADLAARTLATIGVRQKCDRGEECPSPRCKTFNADRERVASDLAGLREHQPFQYDDLTGCDACCVEPTHWVPWLCPDAARYADGLRRTAALYGVTP